MAMRLLENPTDFLSTVQVGITLIGVLAGAFSGATLAGQLGVWLDRWSWIAPYGQPAAIAGRGDRSHLRLARRRRARTEAHRAQRSGAHRVGAGAADAWRGARVAAPAVWLPGLDGGLVASVRLGARSQA